MYAGRPVEHGTAEDVFYRPTMPYTMGLLAAVPRPDIGRATRLVPIEGTPPSLLDLPPGCPFAPRCPLVEPRCLDGEPPLVAHGADPLHRAACVRGDEIVQRRLSYIDVYPVPEALPSPYAHVPRDAREPVLEVEDLHGAGAGAAQQAGGQRALASAADGQGRRGREGAGEVAAKGVPGARKPPRGGQAPRRAGREPPAAGRIVAQRRGQ